MKNSTHLLPPQKIRLTQLKKQRNHKKTEAVVTSKNKKNDTIYKADKSRSIPVTNLSNESPLIEKPS